MERKTIVRSLVALNVVLLCVLGWLFISEKKAAEVPEGQDSIEVADSLKSIEIQKDSLESSNSSCVYKTGNGAGALGSGSTPGK